MMKTISRQALSTMEDSEEGYILTHEMFLSATTPQVSTSNA